MSFPLKIQSRSAKHRAWQAVGYALLVIVWLAAPFVLPDFQIQRMTTVVIFGVAILGLNLIAGFGGQLSLGHSAFFGIGAYTTAILMSDLRLTYWSAIVPAVLLGVIAGALVGLPTLRLRGLYLALVTFAISFIFPVLVNSFPELTGGPNGKVAIVSLDIPMGLPLTSVGWRFVIVGLVGAVVTWLVSNLTRSRAGRALIATRDNELAAQVSGINATRYKSITFTISAAIGALAGALFLLTTPIVSPESVGFSVTILMVTGLMVGGLGTVSGSLIGGLVVVWLPIITNSLAGQLPFIGQENSGVLSNAIYGAILILLTLVAPGGAIALVRMVRERFVQVVEPPLGTKLGGELETSGADDHDRKAADASREALAHRPVTARSGIVDPG